MMKEIAALLKNVKRSNRPIKQKPLDDAHTEWLHPEVMCEVQYASLTKDGMLREPVFVRLRPDLM
jgi:bifunctional non-homologous end joining protein LigD